MIPTAIVATSSVFQRIINEETPEVPSFFTHILGIKFDGTIGWEGRGNRDAGCRIIQTSIATLDMAANGCPSINDRVLNDWGRPSLRNSIFKILQVNERRNAYTNKITIAVVRPRHRGSIASYIGNFNMLGNRASFQGGEIDDVTA